MSETMESYADTWVDPHAQVIGGVDTGAPVEPWSASVDGALRLLPATTLANSAPGGKQITKTVTRLQAYTWVEDLSAQVEFRIPRYLELGPTLGARHVRVIIAVARNLVNNGVASMIESATGRGSGQFATTDYAAVLWARYEKGLDDLVARVEASLPAPVDLGPGITGSFPDVYVDDVPPWGLVYEPRPGYGGYWWEDLGDTDASMPDRGAGGFGTSPFGTAPFGGAGGDDPDLVDSETSGAFGTSPYGTSSFGGSSA
jgi:hypothetical protein